VNRRRAYAADLFKKVLDNLPDGELSRLNQLQHKQDMDEYWVANQERFQGNINDLLDEKSENRCLK